MRGRVPARRRRAREKQDMTDMGDALAPGTRLDEFEIERALGVGGFGVTYLAVDTQLGRQAAIKEYLPLGAAKLDQATNVTYMLLTSPGGERVPVKATDHELGRTHFMNEARALVRLNHPHIVRGYRVIENRSGVYLVMEYLEGRTLAEELRRGPLPESRVRGILAALSEGLQHVHAAWLVHSDVKPSNVMLRADGTPVLIDFGAARQAMAWRSIDEAQVSLLPVTSVLTPGYAPIEQHNPRLRQGPWTDIYALGAVAYEALSGRRPDPAPRRVAEGRQPWPVRVMKTPRSPGSSSLSLAIVVQMRFGLLWRLARQGRRRILAWSAEVGRSTSTRVNRVAEASWRRGHGWRSCRLSGCWGEAKPG